MRYDFWKNESGAITVDWTVMTAAVVGMGIASVAAVRTGTGNLGESIRIALDGGSVASLRWAFARDLVSQSFADGDFSGWSVARHQTFGAWGDMLGPFGTETMNNPLTYDVNLPDGIKNALIQFDMIIADSWDGVAGPNNPWTNALGDSMRLMVDGQVITAEHFVHRENHPGYVDGMFSARSATATIGDTTFNLTMTPRDQPTSNVSGGGWNDQRWSVTLEAIDAPPSFQLGFSGTANQSTIHNANTTNHDESFGIQNFTIKGN